MKGADYRQQQAMARRLSRARIVVGLTQSDVARALGVSQSTVSKLESGEARLTVIVLAQLAKLYKKPVAYFTQS